MNNNLYDLLKWLSFHNPKIQFLIQNSTKIADTVNKVLDKYPLAIVKRGFHYTHRAVFQVYQTEKEMPRSYPEMMILMLDDQCKKLLSLHKQYNWPIINNGFDHPEPHGAEQAMDNLNRFLSFELPLKPYPA